MLYAMRTWAYVSNHGDGIKEHGDSDDIFTSLCQASEVTAAD